MVRKLVNKQIQAITVRIGQHNSYDENKNKHFNLDVKIQKLQQNWIYGKQEIWPCF